MIKASSFLFTVLLLVVYALTISDEIDGRYLLLPFAIFIAAGIFFKNSYLDTKEYVSEIGWGLLYGDRKSVV